MVGESLPVMEKPKLSEPLNQYEAIVLKWFSVSQHLMKLMMAPSAGHPSTQHVKGQGVIKQGDTVLQNNKGSMCI